MTLLLQKPLVTEKLTSLQEKHNQYSFMVDMNVSKGDIKAEVEKMYPDVKVLKVNTLVMPSKPKGRYTRSGYIPGRSKKWKKAIVTLREGDSIDFFSEI